MTATIELVDEMSSESRSDLLRIDRGIGPPDRGCAVWHRCLSCPLSVCVEDRPRQYQSSRTLDRYRDALAAFREAGCNAEHAARISRIPRQTVFRALRWARDQWLAAGLNATEAHRRSRMGVVPNAE